MNTNLAYQDEIWEELIDGKIVAMSPRPNINHSYVSSNIYTILDRYLNGKSCTPFADGVDLYLTEKDHFIPDGMIICDPDKIKFNSVHGAPDLVVEVLSPSTAKNDKGYKKEAYAAAGVKEYWIVNPVDKSIEQYVLENGQFVLHDIYMVHPEYEIESMTEEERAALVTEFKCSLYDDLLISLEDVFRRVK
jgi:Uma2 family endonuclease